MRPRKLFLGAFDGDGALAYEGGYGTDGGKNWEKNGADDTNSERELDNGFIVFVLDGNVTDVALGDEIFHSLN